MKKKADTLKEDTISNDEKKKLQNINDPIQMLKLKYDASFIFLFHYFYIRSLFILLAKTVILTQVVVTTTTITRMML